MHDTRDNICGVLDTVWRTAIDSHAMGMAKTHTDGLLTPSQVAERWKVSLRTVQRYIAAGKLTAIRLPGGQYRIRPEDAASAITEASA